MDYYEAQELACAILGLNYDELVDEGRESEIEETLWAKFNIDIDNFVNLLKALLPFTPVVKAGLSGSLYHAFVNEKEGIMIVKQAVKENPT